MPALPRVAPRSGLGPAWHRRRAQRFVDGLESASDCLRQLDRDTAVWGNRVSPLGLRNY